MNNLKYDVQEINFNHHAPVIHDLLPDHVNATITTDGGGELSGLLDVIRTANNHGYEVRTTATNASSQNGIVERPH